MSKHLTLLLFIGLTWGQNTTSLSPNDDRATNKLVQSFRSDLGKFYTVYMDRVVYEYTIFSDCGCI